MTSLLKKLGVRYSIGSGQKVDPLPPYNPQSSSNSTLDTQVEEARKILFDKHLERIATTVQPKGR